VVGRCVGATTRAVVGGWVVVEAAVVGAPVVGAAVVGAAVVVEAAERAAVLAGGVGGLATNPTRPSRDTRARAASGVMICSLRYQGRSGRGRGGGGAPHCGGVGCCWPCGGPHAGGRPDCGGGVDPAGGWLGCWGPQPCGFTHRSGTPGLPSTERGCSRHYRRLRQSDRYGFSAGRKRLSYHMGASWSFSRSFHRPLPDRPCPDWPDSPPDLACGNRTRPITPDGRHRACKQQVVSAAHPDGTP
jgi:hypothetical protein